MDLYERTASANKNMSVSPSAPARLLCAAILIPGLLVLRNLPTLAAVASLASIVCLSLPSARGPHLKFVLFLWTPLAAWMFIVWGWIVGAAPGATLHSSPHEGVLHAARVALRLLALVGVLQSCLLSIKIEQLSSGLLALKVPRPLALVVLNVFALGPELRIRLDQVLTARIARGLMKRNSRLSAIRNAASTLVPVVAWGFSSAHARAGLWRQRGILDAPQLTASAGFSRMDWLYIVAAMCWTMGCLIARGAYLW